MRRWIGTASVIMLLLALGTHGWSETQPLSFGEGGMILALASR